MNRPVLYDSCIRASLGFFRWMDERSGDKRSPIHAHLRILSTDCDVLPKTRKRYPSSDTEDDLVSKSTHQCSVATGGVWLGAIRYLVAGVTIV